MQHIAYRCIQVKLGLFEKHPAEREKFHDSSGVKRNAVGENELNTWLIHGKYQNRIIFRKS